MELLEAYIPIDRRLAMARGFSLPDRTHGTALFADISGFTPLTERLSRELGPQRGAEELTKQLNIIYSTLIDQVDQYRGSVINFSGDAITCWFDDNPRREARDVRLEQHVSQASRRKPQASSALRALACALAMQEVMGQIGAIATPSGATVTLAIKVAVAAGPVRRFLVGDPRVQYIDVLAGATLDRLAAAEHAAAKGEVVASAEAIAELGDLALAREWRAGEAPDQRFAVVSGLARSVPREPWVEHPGGGLTDEQTRPWLLPVVYARLREGQGQFLAELRPAVALFARFGGIDYDADEQASAKLDAYVRWAQSIVARYDGALLQLTIGDKGSYFYAAFGAPVAHDDDAMRAVAAALELQAIPSACEGIVGTQIGISRGRMRAGAYGAPTRRTYGVLGDEVNMAARLMSSAELGQILVSQPIADVIARRFTLRYVGPISVKGKQVPVPVSLVLDRLLPSTQRPATLFGNPLVGREAELARMTEILQAVGGGQVLRIEGAAGVGKSHLAAELVERGLGWGMRVAVGLCQSTTESTAYAPWRQVLRALLGLEAEPGATEEGHGEHVAEIAAVQRFVAAANPDWRLRLPLLGDLLGLPIPDNATTAAFEPRLRQRALYDLVVEMLQTLAREQPLLLLIDDAHWMDEASKGLTLALGRAMAAPPILLTLVQRPAPHAEPLLPELDGLPFYRRIDLDELSAQGVATLVEYRLGGKPSPLALSLIQAETQGNPFFVEEVIDALRESGNLYRREDGEWWLAARMFEALQQANMLTRASGYWELAPDVSLSAVELGLPDSIQGVVLSRIDRLPEAHKLTLKVASVIGRTFGLDLVAQTHPSRYSDEELLEQIRLLEEREFTRLEVLQRLIYLFKHTVTRDVAYETLLFDQRRQLHRTVGEALERLAPEATAQLAYHSFAGEDWERALRYQMLAGQQAQKLFANHEGIEHLRKALQAAEHLPAEQTIAQRQQAHAALGELLTNTGQYDRALEHLETALGLAIDLADREAQASTCRWIARLYENRGEYPRAQEWIQRGLNALGNRQIPLTAELMAIAGLIQTRLGNYEEALRLCEASLNIAERPGQSSALAFAYTSRAVVAYRRGNSAGTIDDSQKALDLYRQADNIHGQAMSYNQIANAFFNLGQWTEASEAYSRARAVFNQTGDIYNQAIADNNLGGIALNQGRLDEALTRYQEALHIFEQIGASRYMIGIIHMNLGATYVRRHEIQSALDHLETSRNCFASAQARDFLPEMYRHFAEAALAAGDLAGAEAQGQQALLLARELAVRGEEGHSLRVLGEVAARQGLAEPAEHYLDASIAILEEIGEEYERARSELALAGLFLSRRATEPGLELLARCEMVFHRLGAALDLLEAHSLRDSLVTVS